MAERRLGESLFNINIPHVPPAAWAVTATHSVELVKSSFTRHTSAQMSRRSTQCLPCLESLPQLSFILCHLRRCDSRTRNFPPLPHDTDSLDDRKRWGPLLIGARSPVARNVYARVRDAATACTHGCDSRKRFGLYQESPLSRTPC